MPGTRTRTQVPGIPAGGMGGSVSWWDGSDLVGDSGVNRAGGGHGAGLDARPGEIRVVRFELGPTFPDEFAGGGVDDDFPAEGAVDGIHAQGDARAAVEVGHLL